MRAGERVLLSLPADSGTQAGLLARGVANCLVALGVGCSTAALQPQAGPLSSPARTSEEQVFSGGDKGGRELTMPDTSSAGKPGTVVREGRFGQRR